MDLPVSKAGGSCHNQAPVIADNIVAEMRLGQTVSHYDGKVQAVAQMGLNAGMLRNGFNRGLYWATVRGLI